MQRLRPLGDVLSADTRQLRSVLRSRWALLLVFAVALTYFVCREAEYLSVPEYAVLDMWFHARTPRAPHPDIALIGIARAPRPPAQVPSANGAPQPDCTCGAVRRDVLGDAIIRIKKAGAKVTALDLVFDLHCPVKGHDERLLAAVSYPGDTVLVEGSNPTPDRFNFTGLIPELATRAQPIVASPVVYNPRGIIRGVRLIQTDLLPAGAGSLAALTDSVTQVVPPLALACYAAYVGQPEELPEELSDTAVQCAGLDIPVMPGEVVNLMHPKDAPSQRVPGMHALLINWAGTTGTFPMYSLDEILSASDATLAQRLAGRIVIIGSIEERKYPPMGAPARTAAAPMIDQSREVAMTGLEIHANALNTILQRQFIETLPASHMCVLVFCLVFASLFFFRSLDASKAAALTIVMLGGLALAARFSIEQDRWLYVVVPTMGVLLGGLTGEVWSYAVAVREASSLSQEAAARDVATSTIVHDLKQPLVSISCLAQTVRLQQQSGDADQLSPELLQGILRQVERALGDIDELLMTDPGRSITPNWQKFDLAALASDLAVAQAMKSTVHEVEVRAPDEGAWVAGDPRYLGRALSNLVDNAIKYWPDGGTVIVEIDPGPRETQVRVIDQGLGIPIEAQATIFTRFGRATHQGANIPGIGIGLFSIKKIMDAHQGRVDVHSEPGKGSVFVLTIPNEVPEVAEVTEREGTVRHRTRGPEQGP
jgi:signal transduction histidine kinase